MKNEIFRTKHFNAVTNSQHGACLLFDRKGLGAYQSQAPRIRFFSMRKNFSAGALSKAFLSLRSRLKNIMDMQKLHLSLRSRQVHQ